MTPPRAAEMKEPLSLLGRLLLADEGSKGAGASGRCAGTGAHPQQCTAVQVRHERHNAVPAGFFRPSHAVFKGIVIYQSQSGDLQVSARSNPERYAICLVPTLARPVELRNDAGDRAKGQKGRIDELGISLVFADLWGFAEPGRGRARHGDAWRPARDAAVPTTDLRRCRNQRFRGSADTDGFVVRGRLADDGDADRGH